MTRPDCNIEDAANAISARVAEKWVAMLVIPPVLILRLGRAISHIKSQIRTSPRAPPPPPPS
jgi:hypothetical protein